MGLIDFTSSSIITIVLVFIIAATVVWVAGTKLSKLADELSAKTGLGRAFIGVLLLGGITSLPEIATTVTASLAGNAGMAVSNILGGISMQITILAVIDFWVRKQPISTATSKVVIIMQGVWLIIMLALAGFFMMIPGWNVYHVGINSFIIFIIFFIGLYIVHRFSSFKWMYYDENNFEDVNLSKTSVVKEEETINKTSISTFLKRKGGWLALLCLMILAAGYFVVITGESIAERTGISTNFAGLVLIAVTTSLPEISTTIGSIRLQRYDMAFSNIFGTNLFDVALIFIADVLFTKGPVLGALNNFTVVAAFHGIILTAIYVTGITIRSKKNILRMGYDSWLILITYLAGIIILYNMN